MYKFLLISLEYLPLKETRATWSDGGCQLWDIESSSSRNRSKTDGDVLKVQRLQLEENHNGEHLVKFKHQYYYC